MVFQGCSDVVESRVEQAILDPESRRNAASTSDSEQPRRASPWGRADFDDDSVCRAGLSINKLSDLSIDRLNCSGGRVGRRIRAQRSTGFTRLSNCREQKEDQSSDEENAPVTLVNL